MSNTAELEELAPEVLPRLERDEDVPAGGAPLDGRGPASSGTGRARGSVPQGLLWSALIGALVGLPAVVAYAAAGGQAPVYEARAELVYEGSGNATVDDRALATQIALLESRGFLEESKVVRTADVDELQDVLTIERVDGSNVIRIAVQDPSSARALSLVTALAQRHLEGAVEPDVRVEQRELLTARLLEATQNLSGVLDQISVLGGSIDPAVRGQLERLRYERSSYQSEVSGLQQRLLDLELDELEGTTAPAALLGAPYAMEDPVAPQPVRSAAAGALGGGLVAAAIMALRSRTRHGG